VMAAKSVLPVIGVPISASLDGLDALLSTVQMPTGIPVATVAIDAAANAALLAVAMLAVGNEDLTAALAEYRRELAERTLAGCRPGHLRSAGPGTTGSLGDPVTA